MPQVKPTTILVQKFLTDHLRQTIHATIQRMERNISHSGADVYDRGRFTLPAISHKFPKFIMRPVIAGVLDISRLDTIEVFHTECAQFLLNEKDPQVSCHMVGHVVWNTTMRRELVSIRWRFNLNSEAQTNAYITYL